ncbi:MAG: cyclic-phosphate processing receiver domain-containing protein [Burkholderia contaminans]|uniref:Cyclic-phosphate processing Receiver domain-containing protein n=1 Tax=Burkholderia contaminans TaxID=488447 RepID=A0AAP4VNP1_9BURK|nr:MULTISPECIES: cyclic-phosphate processing receiver domain-containing protein [Burkholderia]MBD1415226.1 hypothetical protein [Burkholderia contaminans]MCA7880503.1 hypothetical protein [Burkholderia contaminans]MDN7569131.1 hypothetical protein [Burkholderia contaminans]MDN8025872.1 hypothetical protein [Burkholderia contaminans]PRG06875.1 hypothetical protein C6Q17_24285 [Burkholderia contaminans]
MKLFLDDLRAAPGPGWTVVRSSAEAIDLLQTHGCPKLVSFGHDLGGDDTAMVMVRWLIERNLDQGGQFIPPKFRFQVHSANPVGRENITGLLGGYLEQRSDR